VPKPIWKGSAGIVEGGVTFAFAGGGAARRPERPRITNDEDERIAAREKAEALAKAAADRAAAQPAANTTGNDPSGTQQEKAAGEEEAGEGERGP
jgi:hypothetical protein